MNTVRLIERVYCTTLDDIWEGMPELVASSTSEDDSDDEAHEPTMQDIAPSILIQQKSPTAKPINDETLNDLPDLVQSSSSEDSDYDDSDGDDNDGFGPAVDKVGGVKFYSLNSLLSSKPLDHANDPSRVARNP